MVWRIHQGDACQGRDEPVFTDILAKSRLHQENGNNHLLLHVEPIFRFPEDLLGSDEEISWKGGSFLELEIEHKDPAFPVIPERGSLKKGLTLSEHP